MSVPRSVLLVAVLFAFLGVNADCKAEEAPVAQGATVELQNPSFSSEGSPNSIPGWTTRGEKFAKAETVTDPVVAKPNALRLTIAGPGSMGDDSFMLYQVLDHEQLRGRKMRFGAHVKTEGAGLNIVLWTPEGSESIFDQDVNSGEYILYKKEMTVPSKASFLSFGIQVLGAAGGVAYVDEAFLESADSETSVVPASTQSEELPSGSARIEIRAKSNLHEVIPLIFGMHIEWADDGLGLMEPNEPRLRSEAIDRLKPLSLPLLRFPGGIHADYYDWAKGIGSPAERGTSKNIFTGEMERHRFGTPEFVQLLKITGAKALITANYGTGAPDAAAKWARYLKDAGEEPPFWEVGNEIYLSGPESDGPNGREIYHSPEDYAREFPAFRNAIRGVLPDAAVGAIAHLDTGAFPLAPNENPDWTRRMLAALKTRADFLAVHNAYAPVIIDDSEDMSNEKVRREVYLGMYAAAQQVRENLDLLYGTVEELSPINAGILVGLTEFGPLFGISKKMTRHTEYVDHTRSMGAAIYTASLLHVLLGDPRVLLACYTNPIHPWYGSLLTDTPQGLVQTPTYYLYSLFRTRFESRVVETRTSSPQFNTRRVGIVKAQKNVPYLLSRASISEDGKRLTAMIVNRELDRGLSTKIVFRDFTPSRVDCKVLSSSSPFSLNGPRLTDSTNDGQGIAPRDFFCTAAPEMTIVVPANSVLSLVATR